MTRRLLVSVALACSPPGAGEPRPSGPVDPSLVDTGPLGGTDPTAPDPCTTPPDPTEPGDGTCATPAALTVSSSEPWSIGYQLAIADVTGEGDLDLLVGAPFVGMPLIAQGGVVVTSGADRGLRVHGTADWAQTWQERWPGDSDLGWSIVAGQLDGEPRVLVSASSRKHDGRAYLLAPPLPEGELLLDEVALAWVDGVDADRLGQGLGLHPDLTGDGVANWSAGGNRSSAWPDRPGVAVLLSAAATGPLSRVDDAVATIHGVDDFDLFGTYPMLDVDQDGDGVPELVISAPGLDHPDGTEGSVFWFSTPLVGELTAHDAFAERTGISPEGLLGATMDKGDLDGDGYAEVVVAAPTDHSDGWRAGRVYLVHGPNPGSGPIDQGTTYIRGENPADQLGSDIKVLGDIDGDGTDDLAVGILHNSHFQNEPGEVLVFLGPLQGALDPSDAYLRWSSGCPSDLASSAIDAGDLDGDGIIDLVVGAPGARPTPGAIGAAYLLLGADLGFPTPP